MSPTLRAASFAAVAFCVFAAAVEAAPSIASAAEVSAPTTSEIVISDPAIINASSTAQIPVLQVPALVDAAVPSAPEAADEPEKKFASLRDLVDNADTHAALNREEECLAGAIYFESKSESLEGQHAVAEVIINRSESGRFPGSICGVVYQPSQFSFVRGGRMPAINRGSRDWQEAVAVARVAMDEQWESPASDALFFHATRVSPRWKLKRVATIGNHVFYR